MSDPVRTIAERVRGRVLREGVASITGYGPLRPFFDDPTVEEIWINSPTRVFVAADGRPRRIGRSAPRHALTSTGWRC
ncbi:hypothetical protein [Agromyces sp. SYSU T00266]|uniref:hypothetical protein n=1 Tax=Agromyces zhanjiangensis TaxID=3158562 RepID=UPI00339B7142